MNKIKIKTVINIFQMQLLNPISRNHKNVRRMHTAVELNKAVLENSRDAKLVVINLPNLPKHKEGEKCCILFLQP